MSLSDSDLQDWSMFFDDDIHFNAAVLAESGFYGMYMILFCISVYSVLRGGKRSRAAATLFQLSAFCAMFALSTGLWAMDILDIVVSLQLDRALLFPSDASFQRQDSYNTARNRVIFWGKLLFELDFLIGDALIAWRVFVLYKSQRWAFVTRATLVAFWLADLALVLRETVCWGPVMSIPQDPPLCTHLRQSAWGVSLMLNALASFFIWRVIRQRRATIRTLALGKTNVDRVLYILLVSSTIYISFGLLAVLLTLNSASTAINGLKEMAYIVTLSYDQIVGLYPSIVTIFVLNQETIFGPLSTDSQPSRTTNETTASIHFTGSATVTSHRDQRSTQAAFSASGDMIGRLELGPETLSMDECRPHEG